MSSSVNASSTQAALRLAFVSPAGGEIRYDLEPGNSVIVGSEAACGIQLDDSQVSGRHCMLHLNDGALMLTDWYSDAGTLVNGQKIYAETKVTGRDTIEVGSWLIRVESSDTDEAGAETLDNVSSTAGAPDSAPVPFAEGNASNAEQPLSESDGTDTRPLTIEPESPSPESGVGQRDLTQQSGEVTVPEGDADVASSESSHSPSSLQLQLANLQRENTQLKRSLELERSLNGDGDPYDSPWDTAEGDETSLLRDEVERLQAELVSREEELAELLECSQKSHGAGDEATSASGAPDNPETERLVERLEQLLEELDGSDERVRNLESLLQLSEEATRAERDEREQLANWVSEIESRFADRESEWSASLTRLTQDLEQSESRRARAEASARSLSESHQEEALQQLQGQVTELTEQNALLAQTLETAQAELKRMAGLVSRTGYSEEELEAFRQQQEQLRELEVELSRERAALARQKAETAKFQDELDRATAVSDQDGENPDVRIREFREHLKEIHEIESRERKERSLSNRISRLFRRLDDK